MRASGKEKVADEPIFDSKALVGKSADDERRNAETGKAEAKRMLIKVVANKA